MKHRIHHIIVAMIVLMFVFSSAGGALALDNSSPFPICDYNDQDRSINKVNYYGAFIFNNGGGSFSYSIPPDIFFSHSMWYAEFPGTTIHDTPITSYFGNLYAPNSMNIYFYYLM